MEAEEFIQLATKGDEGEALGALKGDSRLAAARNAAGVSVICLAMYHRRPRLTAALAAIRTDLDIFEAACVGSVKRVKELLSSNRGAANAVSPDGFSPVGYSAFFGHADALRELIRGGGDVNAASRNGMRVCPINSAAAHSDPTVAVELTRIVLEAGADPNARQQAGYTAMHEAALNGNIELVELLLQHGADPSVANDEGVTPIELARSKGHARAVELLEPKS
jgi:ankyrin repeat protein